MKLPCATPGPHCGLLTASCCWSLEKAGNMDWHLACTATSLCTTNVCYGHHNKENMNKTAGEGNTALFSVPCMGRQKVWQVPFSAGGALQQQGVYETLWHDFLTWYPKHSPQVCAHQRCLEGWDCPAEFVFTSDHIRWIYSMFLVFLCTETHKSLRLQPS